VPKQIGRVLATHKQKKHTVMVDTFVSGASKEDAISERAESHHSSRMMGFDSAKGKFF